MMTHVAPEHVRSLASVGGPVPLGGDPGVFATIGQVRHLEVEPVKLLPQIDHVNQFGGPPPQFARGSDTESQR